MMTATPISDTASRRRMGDSGIILITTLFLLVLLSGFAIAAQNRALGQARVLAAVMEAEEARVALQSARALALPRMGEVMLGGVERGEVGVENQGERFLVGMTEAARRNWYSVAIRRE